MTDFAAELTRILDLRGIEGDDLHERLQTLGHRLYQCEQQIENAHGFLDLLGVPRLASDGTTTHTVLARLNLVCDPTRTDSRERLVKASSVVTWARGNISAEAAEKLAWEFKRRDPEPAGD